MKKLALALVAVSALGSINLATAAPRSANAVATWDATAIKDTKSMLVVTPLKSLTFNYAEGLGTFNTQNGAFDITIAGQTGATDFKLTSKLRSNTLNRASDKSALTVGVKWAGQELSTAEELTMVDVGTGVTAGMGVLVANYMKDGRHSTQGVFGFEIKSATVETDGAATTTDFKDLGDGSWTGDINVEFKATWTGDFTTV